MLIRKNVDFGEAGRDGIERAKGNYAIFGGGVAIGIDFERITPVDAVGNGNGEEKCGMTGDFDEIISRSKEK